MFHGFLVPLFYIGSESAGLCFRRPGSPESILTGGRRVLEGILHPPLIRERRQNLPAKFGPWHVLLKSPLLPRRPTQRPGVQWRVHPGRAIAGVLLPPPGG